jgi:hypothetical protein
MKKTATLACLALWIGLAGCTAPAQDRPATDPARP